MTHSGGSPVDRLDRDWEAMAESRVAVFLCAYCDWRLEAELKDGRRAHADHRLSEHGIVPLRPKIQKCAKHDCQRQTRSASGMCSEHIEDAKGNARRRKATRGRPTLGPSISALVVNRYARGFNREDLPTWR